MGYQALYRKYRPKEMMEVVGQNSVVQTIQNSIKAGKISHAYLFTGPRGTGKTSIAKLVAKTVNCLHNEDGTPCNNCDICNKIANNNVSDIIEIDAASNNGVDEIREICNKANLVPSYCKYKVYIIDEVHMLSTGAFNALLKTLEEPPKHVIFILATTNVHKIPLTIISRCQRFDFKKISNDDIVKRLSYIAKEEKIKIEEDALYHIAEICDGGMRDSIGLLDQLSGYTSEKITVDNVDAISGNINIKEIGRFVEAIFNNENEYVLEKISEYNNDGKDLVKFVEKLLIYMRDILLCANANDYFKRKMQDDTPYRQLVSLLKNVNIYNIIDELNSLLLDMKNTNNYLVLLEIKMLKIMSYKEEQEASDEPTTEIVQEKKEEKKDKTQDFKEIKPVNYLPELIDVRINNAFVDPSKTILEDMKNNWNDIRKYVIDKEHSDAASLLLDGVLKVASNENIIVVYPYLAMANRANAIAEGIEKVLKLVFNKKIKFVAVSEDEWQKAEEEFKIKWKNKDKYTYIDEKTITNPKPKNKKSDKIVDEALELFGSVVEID